MEITANHADLEPWRIKRLEKALDLFCHIFGVTDEQAEVLIHALHDHKGTMLVIWASAPTERQKDAMLSAWKLCKESEVQHSWLGAA